MGDGVVIPVFIYEPDTAKAWDVNLPAVPRKGERIMQSGRRYVVTSVIWKPESDLGDQITVRVAEEV